MQFFKTVFSTFFFFFFFVVSSGAIDFRVGIVDIQRIVDESSAGKRAQAEIKREGKKLEDELKSRRREIERLTKKLEREAAVMSREQRERKERDLNIKVYDFKATEKKSKEKFFKFQNQKLDRMREDILEIVKEIGRAEGYHLIMQKAGVLYFTDAIDITDKLIRQYNAKF